MQLIDVLLRTRFTLLCIVISAICPRPLFQHPRWLRKGHSAVALAPVLIIAVAVFCCLLLMSAGHVYLGFGDRQTAYLGIKGHRPLQFAA